MELCLHVITKSIIPCFWSDRPEVSEDGVSGRRSNLPHPYKSEQASMFQLRKQRCNTKGIGYKTFQDSQYWTKASVPASGDPTIGYSGDTDPPIPVILTPQQDRGLKNVKD